jgi:RHS repeat-associated protein
VDGNGQNVLSQSFVYDAGNRKSSQSETQGTGAAVTTLFAYDKQDRLLGSERSDGKRVTYGYDGAGNRTSQSDCNNGSCVESVWVYNQFNQVVSMTVAGVTTTYSHDRDGNRTGAVSPTEKSTLEWNAEGKLTNAWVQVKQAGSWVSKDGKAEAYQYDSMGRRTKTYTLDPDIPTYPTLTRETVYGRGWEELQRLDGANTSNPTTTDLLSIDGGLVPRKLASYSGTNASATRASYYQLDALGSGRAVTGAGGAVQGSFASFSDFGTRLSTTDQPLTPSYTGYEHDAYTGLEYAKNRYYDPQTASFISSDPYPVDPSDLLGMNLYNYVQGNPVNSTDPLGWFVITGYSLISQEYFIKTQENDDLQGFAKTFNISAEKFYNWAFNQRVLSKYYLIRNSKEGLSKFDRIKTIPDGERLRAPMCFNNAKCYENVMAKVAIQNGITLIDYDKPQLQNTEETPNQIQSVDTHSKFLDTNGNVLPGLGFDTYDTKLGISTYLTALPFKTNYSWSQGFGLTEFASYGYYNGAPGLRGLHNGLDFSIPYGTPIYWTGNGTGKVYSNGSTAPFAAGPFSVVIEFNDYYFIYGHTAWPLNEPNRKVINDSNGNEIDPIVLSVDDFVNPGDLIGYSGDQQTYPKQDPKMRMENEHFHLEVRPKDKAYQIIINPYFVFSNSVQEQILDGLNASYDINGMNAQSLMWFDMTQGDNIK